MSVPVPVLLCAVACEAYNPQNELSKREEYKKAEISLNRNQFNEIILRVAVLDKKGNDKTHNLPVSSTSGLQLHRKFVKEGKLSLSFQETRTKLLLSNAPPNELVIFAKSLAAKLAGTADQPRVTVRQKLETLGDTGMEGISPVTAKDIKKMQNVEAGGRGLLKMRGYTPGTASPLSAGKSLKRKRLDGTAPTTPVGGEGATPKRQATLMARRHLREGKVNLVMSAEQRYVVEVVKSGKNLFFTGGAGTGKSFLINKIIGILPPEHTFITASTGVAAFQIGGTTLHSFGGIGSGSAVISKCIELGQRKTVAAQWKKCKHLIIDEISMVDGNYFKKLEAVARAVRGNEKPFGGIQLILTGDFLQLPPVVKGEQERRYAFETSAWKRCIHTNIELTQVRRQSDQQLVSILKQLRVGVCGEREAEVLAGTKNNNISQGGIVPTKLCTHTEDVNLINSKELSRLEGEEKVFRARDSDSVYTSFLNSHTPIDQIIKLRVGAQVMLMKNLNVGSGLVNGARGVVDSFGQDGNPVIKFIGGLKETMKLERWQVKGGGGALITRHQLPLRLAWAFSIHKSQGMTLDCVEVSLSRVFESGQAYVALSRAKNLSTLRILDFRPTCVRADPKVLQFYKNLQCSRPMQQTTLPFTEQNPNTKH